MIDDEPGSSTCMGGCLVHSIDGRCGVSAEHIGLTNTGPYTLADLLVVEGMRFGSHAKRAKSPMHACKCKQLLCATFMANDSWPPA